MADKPDKDKGGGGKKPSGALNVERRTWDVEHFEKLAKEKLERQAAGQDTGKPKPGFVRKREEFMGADSGAAGPEGSKRAYLKHREQDLRLDEKVNKIQVVTSQTAPQQQGGYWCDVCQCLLKDSMAYLDHINGKKHQRALGFSMRVERVGVDKVKGRLQALKQQEEAAKTAGPKEAAIEVYERKLEEAEKAKEAWKEARKEARKQLREEERKAKNGGLGLDGDDEDGEGEEGGLDPEIAAAMGFGGFK